MSDRTGNAVRVDPRAFPDTFAASFCERVVRAGGVAGGVRMTSFALAEAEPSAGRLIVLYDGLLGPTHAEALQRRPPTMLLAARDQGLPSLWEVEILVALLTDGPLKRPQLCWTETQVGSIADVQESANAARQFAEEKGCAPGTARVVEDVAHELAANALFDAPVTLDGRKKYAHRRTEEPLIAPEDACELSFTASEGRIFVFAADRFGALTVQPVAKAVAQYRGRVSVDASGGGAGLGLRRVLEHSDLVAARVVAGRQTQMLCAIDMRTGRRRSADPKTVLFFEP